MHGLNGCIMGFFLGKHVFSGDNRYLIYSFIVPFFMHGIYNYYVEFGVLIVVVQLVYALRLHGELKKLQLSKKSEKELKKFKG